MNGLMAKRTSSRPIDRMSLVYNASCRCGYRASDLIDGFDGAGIRVPMNCLDCRESVSMVSRWWKGAFTRGDEPETGVCPKCGGRKLETLELDGESAGPCPRCASTMMLEATGVAG
jgi:hypothetical protein